MEPGLTPLWLVVVGAWAGQVFDREVSLDDVVEGADALARVTIVGDGPATAVPLEGEGCTTYPTPTWRVEVREVLGQGGRGPALNPGDALDVLSGRTPIMVDVATAACRDQLSISPIIEAFPGATPTVGETRVVALRWRPPYGWTEAVSGSWLEVGRATAAARAWASATHPASSGRPESFEVVVCRVDADCTLGAPVCSACGPCPDTPLVAVHVAAAASFARACQNALEPPAIREGSPPPPPPPACSPCLGPGPSSHRAPVCRQGRCTSP